MKLSEILKDWPEKNDVNEESSLADYWHGYNTALTSCDREVDREALIKIIDNEGFNIMDIDKSSIEASADLIISTMPQWLKRIENGKI